MQDVISEIFDRLGGSTAIANGIDCPVQTVNDWLRKGKPEIPPWRRAAVLAFAKRTGSLLTPQCLEYLQSQERTVGRAAAQDEAA